MLVPTYQAIRYHIPEDFSLTEDRLLLCQYLLHIVSVLTEYCVSTYCIVLLFLQSLFHTNANFSWPPIKI